ncbi:MAG: Flp pilus assembly protein CpaB [Pseudomonas sp.]
MNSRFTMALAVFFLLGALMAGYWGLVVSGQPAALPVQPPVMDTPVVSAPAPPPVATEDPTRQPVVVLVRDVPAYTPIQADDLVIERLKVAPSGSLGAMDDVVGRSAWRTLSAGSWLSESSFEAGGALARMIRVDERALALTVDEVIGAGGQLSPGDYVDVLLYLPQDTANPDRSSQLAVPALRVLSVGEVLGPTRDGKPAQNLSADQRLQLEQRKSVARNVVVAVPQSLLSRLMLATQTGVLRLAVRSADEKNLEQYWASDDSSAAPAAVRLDSARRDLLSFTQLSQSGPARVSGAASGPRPARAVEVIRGNQTAQKTP